MEGFSVAVIYYGRDAAKEVKMEGGIKEPSAFVSLWRKNTAEETEDAVVTVMLAILYFI
jgi:hypothetical protein